MATGDFGRGKTIFVLAVVIGCFAILWPKIFYPMLTASLNPSGEEGERKYFEKYYILIIIQILNTISTNFLKNSVN